MTEARFRKTFLLLLVVAISVGFLALLQPFLTTILLAAIFSGLAHPVYARMLPVVKGNRPLASGLTLLLMLVLVVVPMLAILGVVVNQALRVTDSIAPFIERLINEPTFFDEQVRRVPGLARLEPYRDQIITRLGDVVGAVGTFLVGSLSSTTRGTVTFVFQFFLMLYSMFFLLIDGQRMLQALLSYLPLNEDDREQMTHRFMSVTRATVKGTIIIGIVQGGLAGLAFARRGHPGRPLLVAGHGRAVDPASDRRRARVGSGLHHPRGERRGHEGRAPGRVLCAHRWVGGQPAATATRWPRHEDARPHDPVLDARRDSRRSDRSASSSVRFSRACS